MIRDGRAAIHSFWKRGLWNAINSTLCPIFKNVLIYDQINKTMPPSSRKYQFFELFRDSKAHNFSRAQLFCLKYWNSHMKNQYEQCLAAGPKKCMMVFYDRLVQNPGAEVPRIARFLNLSMHLNMLNHHWHFSDEIYARYWLSEALREKIIIFSLAEFLTTDLNVICLIKKYIGGSL